MYYRRRLRLRRHRERVENASVQAIIRVLAALLLFSGAGSAQHHRIYNIYHRNYIISFIVFEYYFSATCRTTRSLTLINMAPLKSRLIVTNVADMVYFWG